ncbi:MAG: arsenic efflux protein [Bacilli bacterium]|nr:arsenic efflux protein [Bacilli bacterium]
MAGVYFTPIMWDVVLEALLDSLKILGVVFLVHVLLSFFEGKLAKVIEKNHRYAPAFGALFGVVPECGTSVVGADLYQRGHLTMGTLVAIFLACSDEALPILFGNFTGTWYMAFVLIGLKIAIAVLVGFTVDLIHSKGASNVDEHLEHCEGEEHAHQGCCGHAIEGHENPWVAHLLHPILHSLKIFAYVLALNLAFGFLFYFVGEEPMMDWLSQSKPLTPLFAILVGLIPNCASSVLLANCYLQGVLPFASLLAGLLVNAGLGMLVLFRDKKHWKDALIILSICLGTALAFGYALLYVF